MLCAAAVVICVSQPSCSNRSSTNLAIIKSTSGREALAKEAALAFRLFGTNQMHLFDKDDLTNFPFMEKIGKVDYLLPQNASIPANIQIRLGGHNDGTLILVDTNNAPPYQLHTGEIRLAPSLILAP